MKRVFLGGIAASFIAACSTDPNATGQIDKVLAGIAAAASDVTAITSVLAAPVSASSPVATSAASSVTATK